MKVNAIGLYIFLVIQLYCFALNGIPSFVAKGLALITLFVAILYSPRKESYYNKPLVWLGVCCMVNMIWCSLNRAQSPFEYVIGNEFTNMLGLLGIFAIPAFKLRPQEVEKVLVAVGLTCMAIYLLQYFSQMPLITDEETIEERGFRIRARINGQCVFFFLYLKYLYFYIKKPSAFYGIYTLLSLLCIIIIGFRTHGVALVFVTVLFWWKKNLVNKGTLFGMLVAGIVLYAALQTDVVQDKVNQMIERNEEGTFENEDYSRYLSLEYFTHEAPNGIADRILGIGLPNGNSAYGRHLQELKNYGIIWADWGLIGLAWVLGIPAVLCIVWYAIRAFLTPVRQEHSYLCYWFLLMILSSILTREIYRQGAFPIQAVILYLIAQYRLGNVRLKWKEIWKRK